MRFLFITPGTGSYYCGVCMRDNAQVAELRDAGHEAQIAPLYLPLITDEPSMAKDTPILFGGVNVFLQQNFAFFRNEHPILDKIIDHPTLLKWVGSLSGMTEPEKQGPLIVSMLQGREGKQVKELEKLVAWIKESEKPDVIIISTALLSGMAEELRDATGAPVLCMFQGEDTFLDSLHEPYRAESWELLARNSAKADALIAPSRFYANFMASRLKMPASDFSVIHNGISLDGYNRGEAQNPPIIGFLARMIPAKGLDLLIDAFIKLRNKNVSCRLKVAGATIAIDHKYIEEQKNKLKKADLLSEASFHPNIGREEKQAFFRSISVFSVPARYNEAFGLYLIEAMASGVPVVQPDIASFTEIIQLSEAGLLCEANSSSALADAIEKLLINKEEADRFSRNGIEYARKHFSINASTKALIDFSDKLTL